MTLEENKQTVRRFVEELQGKGNFAAIYQYLPSNFVDHTPMAGVSADRDGVRKLFTLIRSGIPDMSVEIHDMIAEGDKVVTRKTFSGHQTADLFGVPATGKAVTIEVIDLLRVENGRVLEHWGIAGLAGLMQQLGVF